MRKYKPEEVYHQPEHKQNKQIHIQMRYDPEADGTDVKYHMKVMDEWYLSPWGFNWNAKIITHRCQRNKKFALMNDNNTCKRCYQSIPDEVLFVHTLYTSYSGE